MANQLPFTYTGADFYALCSDAMLKAVTRQASHVDARIKALNADPATGRTVSTAYFFDHLATEEDLAVTEADFIEAQRELVPSVSAGELAHYEKVRKTFEGERSTPDGNAGKSRDKGKGVAPPAVDYKGKGKAVAGPGFSDGDDEEDEEEEEFGPVNGRSKGKGKAVAGFQEGTASDDDGLY